VSHLEGFLHRGDGVETVEVTLTQAAIDLMDEASPPSLSQRTPPKGREGQEMGAFNPELLCSTYSDSSRIHRRRVGSLLDGGATDEGGLDRNIPASKG
jgi:hypothetical protein